jgi:hypothetical protein
MLPICKLGQQCDIYVPIPADLSEDQDKKLAQAWASHTP